MPPNQMTRNKDRPHSYAFTQVGRGIILESALPLREFNPPVRGRQTLSEVGFYASWLSPIDGIPSHYAVEPTPLALHKFWWFPVVSINSETGTHYELESVVDLFSAGHQQ
jgi:hypothetical protein